MILDPGSGPNPGFAQGTDLKLSALVPVRDCTLKRRHTLFVIKKWEKVVLDPDSGPDSGLNQSTDLNLSALVPVFGTDWDQDRIT